MISAIISRIVILLFGTLYPGYASYKAIRTKNMKEYVKWMMYWIVFSLFSCIETFTDIFLVWFPFYYEFKIIIVLWLLSPTTKGSSTLYRKFVHPMLIKREEEIDEYINHAKETGYKTVLHFGSKGVNYATSVIMQTAIKGGGNLVSTLRKSYSLSDLSEPDMSCPQDQLTEMPRTQRVNRSRNAQSSRSSSITRNESEMYFSEIDVATKTKETNLSYVTTSDTSSGYGSIDPIPDSALSRTASMSSNTIRTRLKVKKTEGSDDELDANSVQSFEPDTKHMMPVVEQVRPRVEEMLGDRKHRDDTGSTTKQLNTLETSSGEQVTDFQIDISKPEIAVSSDPDNTHISVFEHSNSETIPDSLSVKNDNLFEQLLLKPAPIMMGSSSSLESNLSAHAHSPTRAKKRQAPMPPVATSAACGQIAIATKTPDLLPGCMPDILNPVHPKAERTSDV